ncbi:MAG: hypothetical protein HY305_01415, partial [Sphingobacteriales bacterium]|nr:hypothetical protein [Sphingobacteriales bacterium]
MKRVTIKDNWNKMTKQFDSDYGQDYDYTTTEKINDKDEIISSGVASYEPGIGGEENPFREILQFSDRLPMATSIFGAVEMPILEGLYPSPVVGYSKVTVRSIHRKEIHDNLTLKSAIGKQVTRYNTAREYPSVSVISPMDKREYHKDPFFSVFYKEAIDRLTISQGFLVETNDMHGKIQSQEAYNEKNELVTGSYHHYINTGKNGLNDKVDFVYGSQSGTVRKGNMGIDMELMTDVRQFEVNSNGFNLQIQIDLLFLAYLTIPIPTIYPFKSVAQNRYRAATCTKLINYHAIEDEITIIDKGSTVSTKTIAYDSETGNPIVSATVNEFDKSVYNVSYPAYWAYSGIGLACQNINRQFTGVDFNNGKIINSNDVEMATFESGDELYITNEPMGKSDGVCAPESENVDKLWVLDKAKNTTSLTNNAKDLFFIDRNGTPFTKKGVDFRIIRSGKRNNLDLTVSAATSLINPIQTVNGESKLKVTSETKVINAAAIDYKEKWQVDDDAFTRYSLKELPQQANLIKNGDFEDASNLQFETGYTNASSTQGGSSPGQIAIRKTINGWNSSSTCGGDDHTSIVGKMLYVDGWNSNSIPSGKLSLNGYLVVWKQTVNIQPHTSYLLSVWIKNIVEPNR